VAELLWLAAGILVAGLVAGLLAGLFGIGGGAVIVPVLFEAFRLEGVPAAIRMQLCLGTSLAIIVPTAMRSYREHRRRDVALAEVVRVWTWPSVTGVAVGAALAAMAPPRALELAFVVIAGIIALRFLVGADRWALDAQLPGRTAMTGYGFAIGLGSSLMGISGGSLATIVLTLYRQSIRSAVATAAGIGVPITIAGTLGYVLAGLPYHAQLPRLSLGFVSLIGVALIAPLASLVAPFGARLAHALPPRRLEIAFGLYLLAVVLRFLINLLPPIA
jgi:uncharacterized protein